MRDWIRDLQCVLKSINRNVTIVLVLIFAFAGCSEEELPWSPYPSKATIAYSTINFDQTSVSGTTVGDSRFSWSLAVEEGSAFCRAKATSGQVGTSFTLLFDRNDGATSSRTAKATITFTNGYTRTFVIEQLGESSNGEFERAWGEQPDYKSNAAYAYKTYFTTLRNGQRVRNYSICYDTEKLVSHWVAYPLHKIYTDRGTYKAGNSNGRTDAWAFDDAVCEYISSSPYYRVVEYDYTDPVIPQSQQWYATATYGGGYARGHMLPSASRYNTFNTNAQTFYSTNIMPQAYDFNGGSWSNLEIKVRSWACADTLYVVVGTLFEGTKKLTKSGRTTLVPSHAFKLVLRTKSGTTGKRLQDITSASELKCIGFLYENSNSEEETTPAEAAISVADIERRSGFKFFRNLNPKVADEVKAQKSLSDWGI